ncbi:putative quinol monooxygenase [Lutimonas sp.]|uniref:putative quinol monooxygenase n=1 Tax=Lutimonas sp. TaxID=1872403 RepID=UPI003D9B98F8
MLIRIVKMTFAHENVTAFQNRFQGIKENIINFEGCNLLELYQDKANSNVFFTYSYWDSEAALDHYRKSSFFKEVWSETKKMFIEKPEAWSVDKIVSLKHPL